MLIANAMQITRHCVPDCLNLLCRIIQHLSFCQQSACWIFSCFRNPPNTDMDCMIFNVRTWSFSCVRVHTCVGHTDSESAQQFWLGKTHFFFLVLLTGMEPSFFGFWVRRSTNGFSHDFCFHMTDKRVRQCYDQCQSGNGRPWHKCFADTILNVKFCFVVVLK